MRDNIILNWGEIEKTIIKLSRELEDKNINVIIGISRGGVIPAGLLTILLGVKEYYTIKIRRYSDDKPPRELSKPEVNYSPLNLEGKNVLIVDDVTHTGETLRLAKKIVEKMKPRKVYTLALVLRLPADYEPDFYGLAVDKCPIFPWERFIT